MNPRKFAGLIVLTLVILVVIVVQTFTGSPPKPTLTSVSGVLPSLTSDSGVPSDPTSTVDPAVPSCVTVDNVHGLIGGKEAFFKDPDIIKILEERYCLTVTYTRVGSLDMVKLCGDVVYEFCFVSNQNSGQEIRDKLGSAVLNNRIIFHTPIVFYTWGPVADALIAQGIVEKRGDIFYLVDSHKLIQMMLNDTQWSDIGLSQIFGKVYVLTTDPAKSTTGNSYAGLVANSLNCGVVVDHGSVTQFLPHLRTLFKGLLPENTTTLFEYYLTAGMGAAPIISAIESNLIEYSLLHPDPATQQYIRQNLVMLYPEPTVLTSQPLIALTEGGLRLMEALRDPDIQLLGWEHHAFRSAVPGVPNDSAVFKLSGMRDTNVTLVIPMPLPAVMNEIVLAIQATPTASSASPSQVSTFTIPSCLSPPVVSPTASTPGSVSFIRQPRRIKFPIDRAA